MRRTLLLALLALASCDDEPPPPADCTTPDFDVLITAVDAPLPTDTVVLMEYGAGDDEYRLTNDPEGPENLFCSPADRQGNPISGDAGEEGPDARNADGGAGGAGGAPNGGTIEGLRCDLWSDGPATLTITTSMYPVTIAKLQPKKGVCTVSTEVEIGPNDGGA